jgi:hypothetical protein
VQPSSEEIAHLEHLCAELNRRGFDAHLVSKGSRLYLKVANLNMPEINGSVFCRPAEDDSGCFWWWPWQRPIGSVDDLDAVMGKIAVVQWSVEGQM